MDQARKVGEKEKEKRQKEKDGYRGVTGLIEIGKPLDLYCEKGSSSVFFFILWYGVCMYFHQGPASYQKKRKDKGTALPISILEFRKCFTHYQNHYPLLILSRFYHLLALL